MGIWKVYDRKKVCNRKKAYNRKYMTDGKCTITEMRYKV